MDLNLYQKRLSAYGGTDKRDRLDYRNKQMLEKALKGSFNAEDVIFEEQEMRALMLEDKLTLNVDQKWFIMKNESGLEPGDVLHVTRNDTRWIMVQEDLNERSFKRCVGSRAVYQVSWRDDDGNIQTSWASLRGPTETSIKTESRKHLLFDKGNEKMMLFLPSKADTNNLERYKYLMVEEETWEIASTDAYTTPGIMAVALVEAQNNPYLDNVDLGIARDDEYVFTNLFDKDLTFGVAQLLSINPMIMKNGKDITLEREEDFVFNCSTMDNIWYDAEHHLIEFLAAGQYEIELGYPNLGYSRTYNVNIQETVEVTDVYYSIEGTTKITPFDNDIESYDIEYYVNGVETIIPEAGTWRYDKKYIAKATENPRFIELEFNGTPGTTKLEYLVANEVVASLEIHILTVFG